LVLQGHKNDSSTSVLHFCLVVVENFSEGLDAGDDLVSFGLREVLHDHRVLVLLDQQGLHCGVGLLHLQLQFSLVQVLLHVDE